MDVKLNGGDIVLANGGCVEMISGLDEILQKIHIILSVKKQSFIFDRELGIFKNGEGISNGTKESLEMLINEGLVNCDCSVKLNSIEENSGAYTLSLTVYDKFKSYETEVKING